MKVIVLVIILYVITMMLQGCVSAIMLGTAAVVIKTANDPRTIGTQIDDNTLELRIANTLAKNQRIKKYTHIVSTVYQGKVLLTGQSQTLDLAEYAKKIVMNIRGVNVIHNEVRYENPISIKYKLIDTWITTNVLLHLLIDSATSLSKIKVNTENGEVFLLGLVTKTDGNMIIHVASKVSGVKRVRPFFTYL